MLLQPICGNDGAFQLAKLSIEHGYVVLYYFGIIFILLIPTLFIATRGYLMTPKRGQYSLLLDCGQIPGNIGIPLGIAAIWGEFSYIYESLLILPMVFVVYIWGESISNSMRAHFPIKRVSKTILRSHYSQPLFIAYSNIYGVDFP